ncbi:MAG: hypothetical protein AAB618_04105 [Patescibacteria group bacterium]
MPKTQRLIVACLALATGVGIGFILSTLFTFETAYAPPPVEVMVTSQQKQNEIFTALQLELEKRGVKTDGLSPFLILEHFSSVEQGDFNGAEAIIGQYEMIDGELVYKSGETINNAAATDISEAGFALFLKNYSRRTGVDVSGSSTTEIIASFSREGTATDPSAPTNNDEFMACTMDAKLCADGSYVGRTGPNCEFTACPSEAEDKKTIVCTKEQKQAEACIEIYAPVCAEVQVECVTTPCNPVPQTYSNSCFACASSRVVSYTEGSCEGADQTTE